MLLFRFFFLSQFLFKPWIFRHVVSKVFYPRMFLSTEGILLVSFPSKSYHFFASVENCPNLQHFRSLNCRINRNYSPNIYVLLFVKKKSKIPHKTFSQISFAVEPFMPFLVIQKRQSLRTVITLHWLQLNLMKRCVFFLWRCTPIFWLYTIPHLSQLL